MVCTILFRIGFQDFARRLGHTLLLVEIMLVYQSFPPFSLLEKFPLWTWIFWMIAEYFNRMNSARMSDSFANTLVLLSLHTFYKGLFLSPLLALLLVQWCLFPTLPLVSILQFCSSRFPRCSNIILTNFGDGWGTLSPVELSSTPLNLSTPLTHLTAIPPVPVVSCEDHADPSPLATNKHVLKVAAAKAFTTCLLFLLLENTMVSAWPLRLH